MDCTNHLQHSLSHPQHPSHLCLCHAADACAEALQSMDPTAIPWNRVLSIQKCFGVAVIHHKVAFYLTRRWLVQTRCLRCPLSSAEQMARSLLASAMLVLFCIDVIDVNSSGLSQTPNPHRDVVQYALLRLSDSTCVFESVLPSSDFHFAM